MRRTTLISLACGSLLAGLALGRLGLELPVWGLIFLGFLALLLLRTRLLLVGLAVLALLLGLWRAQVAAASARQLTHLIGHTMTVTGQVADDPVVDPRGFMTYHLQPLPADHPALSGTIPVYTYPTNLHRGYQLQLTGQLRPGFGNNPVEFNYPKAILLSSHQSLLERWRGRFFAGLRTALPEPAASFGLGLLVGIRALIPKDLQAQLAVVGLSHLVAVSGYNLTIIVAAVHRLLARFGRGLPLVVSFWLIGGFLAATGASASIVRASLIAVLVLLAGFYGRRFQPLTLILLAAVATALWQPAYLTDLGWLLSFLAFFGILIVAPAVEARRQHPARPLMRLLIESVTAQVLTLPLILYIFGDLSLVAPFTNLLVLPLVPAAMLLSFIAGLAGLCLPAFAGWLAWPAYLLLAALLQFIAWAAHLPWASITLHLSLPAMLGLYLCIILITIALHTTQHSPRPEPD